MSTQAISNSFAAAATDTSSSAKTGKKDGLGQDAFLQLLVTQLQHQDPTAPQDDTQFLAQLAQFSSLEQLTQISNSIQQLVALAGGSPSSTSDSSKQTDANTSTTGGK